MAKLAFVWVYKFFSKLNNLKPYRWMSTPIANQCFVLLKKNVTSIIFSQQNLDEKLLLVGG